MARHVVGNDALFEVMANPEPSHQDYGFVQAIQQSYQSAFGNVSSSVTAVVNNFVQSWMDTDAGRRAQALVYSTISLFTRDRWGPLDKDWKVQNAPDPMLRGIMAIPEIRTLANKGMCDGYHDRYYDVTPCADPTQHRDRLLVRNGVLIHNDNPSDDEPEWVCEEYWDDLVPGDPYLELNVIQQNLLQEAEWRALRMIAEDIDPTDCYNGSLGRA